MNTDYVVRNVARTDAGHLQYTVVALDNGDVTTISIPARHAPVADIDGTIRAVLADRRPRIRPLP